MTCDELDLIPVLRLALSQGMPHEALARLFRVYGDGLRRITHTETQLWHDYVDVPSSGPAAASATC